MIYNILLVGVGGLVGSVLRFLIAWATAGCSKYPVGTLLVNVVGCVAAGLVVGFAERQDWAPGVRLFLAVGFCGGFTTFSSFAVENVHLLQERELAAFLIYNALSFALGLGGVVAGINLARV